MKDDERYLEENLSRLLRAGYGSEARPTARAKQTAWHRLRHQLRQTPPPADFPDFVLALLSSLLVLLGAWMLARRTWWAGTGEASLLLAVAGTWTVVNLALLPIASLVVFVRRKLYG